ncbi:TrbI/VirB10 family protein [Photobacterium leiognathi]|uniref:TrbI/VirB10 family protein n=1 Tax=Photobacterium leiognathi TaxID=553611 RepID=UPI00298187CC|nr:TrbI/VirB10 family protein [Photobacterium leiognathi]
MDINLDPRKNNPTLRISKKIMMVFSLIGALILAAIIWALASKGAKSTVADKPDDTTKAVTHDVSMGLNNVLNSAPKQAIVVSPPPEPSTLLPPKKEEKHTAESMLSNALTQEYLALRKAKSDAYLAALHAPTSIEIPDASTNNAMTLASAQLAQSQQQAQALTAPQPTSSTLDSYLNNARTALAPHTLSVGTLLPAVTLSAINSDIAGTIKAQISESIYDSATGSTLLLPQGAQLIGQYGGQVAYGQSRLPVKWYRINFPDGSKININGMEGADSGGQNGFSGDVNNHYWRLFGQSTLLGLIGGGAAAAVSDGNDSENSASETIANSVINQYAQTGAAVIQKNLQVSPTITVPSGYPFNIILTKDVVLPPYHG